MKTYLNKEIDKTKILLAKLTANNLDGILFYSPENRFWLSEFMSSEGYLLFSKTQTTLFLDGRYITDGQAKAKNVTNVAEMITNNPGGFLQMLKEQLIANNINNLGFESNFLTYQHYQVLQKQLAPITLVPVDFSELRAVKTNKEINALAQACAIGDLAIENVLKVIKPGMTEREVEQVIINTFISAGAEKPSFDTIVASGERGALPHGRATERVIQNNELITIDFGCIYNGFCSDTTRTIGVGQPSAKLQEIFQIVYEAQDAAIKAIKPGVLTSTIDQIARDYINSKGYGEYFTHSTGHGVGIEIHEFPRVSPFCQVPLEPGMIITVEPGIYIPNLGGVRIEDDILVTETGYELLTKSDRKLILK
ncbi:Xaa-Pro dipeptidase [Spiroplasma syrphidicola EA-1]|uniref:Xaa-Pro dipeptidase n=1 Tax=Spiroplasma syrphidicola EA-1 TaxID=1276229 RepID=R4U410_9MOLU|nr:aminopeptidase P family protein [Spiroplasma syrphidicola]AGM26162.1 Xaa-Pro dipeptidase [Spiroplasma syrphidicola EA-1]